MPVVDNMDAATTALPPNAILAVTHHVGKPDVLKGGKEESNEGGYERVDAGSAADANGRPS